MLFTFYIELPDDINSVEVISGETSSHFVNTEFLVVQDNNVKRAFKIRYEYHCSPFREAIIQDDLLLVGHEAHFYLYDLEAKVSLLILILDGYFSQIYLDTNCFYVADAESLYCISFKGEIIWHAKNLGIDGVIVEEIADVQIFGSGEWDPPSGWRSFVIEKKNGKQLTVPF